MVVATHDVDEYLALSLDFLLAHEVENGLLISAPQIFKKVTPPYPWLAVCSDRGRVRGVAMRTSEVHRLAFAIGDEDGLRELAAVAREARTASNGFVAPADRYELLADLMAGPVSIRRRLGLYQLTSVTHPQGVTGNSRLARNEDLELLTDWVVAFGAEVDGLASERTGIRTWIESRFSSDGLLVWETEGQVVSMANMTGKTPNTMKINAVYTPPRLRGRGYASACVAAASQHILDQGYRMANLFTDLSNPTSNHIYQSIGYQWAGEFVEAQATIAT